MNLYAVIMAGGVGSRFWPRSKKKMPKQLLNIFGTNTMIQETVERLDSIVPDENIFIVTNKVQKDEIVRQLPNLPKDNIVEEPFGRNTAACIGLASVIIKSRCEDAVTLILPADHRIRDIDDYHRTLKEAAEFASKSKGLVTIGIKPTRRRGCVQEIIADIIKGKTLDINPIEDKAAAQWFFKMPEHKKRKNE